MVEPVRPVIPAMRTEVLELIVAEVVLQRWTFVQLFKQGYIGTKKRLYDTWVMTSDGFRVYESASLLSPTETTPGTCHECTFTPVPSHSRGLRRCRRLL